MQYTVVAVIQGVSIDANKPVEVQWYTGDSLGSAIAAMAQAAAHDVEKDHGDLPESMRYRTLSVTMQKIEEY